MPPNAPRPNARNQQDWLRDWGHAFGVGARRGDASTDLHHLLQLLRRGARVLTDGVPLDGKRRALFEDLAEQAANEPRAWEALRKLHSDSYLGFSAKQRQLAGALYAHVHGLGTVQILDTVDHMRTRVDIGARLVFAAWDLGIHKHIRTTITLETAGTRLASRFGVQDMHVGHAAFDEQARVFSTLENHTRALLLAEDVTPLLMRLLAAPGFRRAMLVNGRLLVLIAPRLLGPTGIPAFLELEPVLTDLARALYAARHLPEVPAPRHRLHRHARHAGSSGAASGSPLAVPIYPGDAVG